MARSKKGGGIGAVALGLAAAACIAIPGGDKSAEDDHRAAASVTDPPAITETIEQQEPQEAVEPKTEETTPPDAQAAQEPAKTPQDTQQTITQPEAPKQEQPKQEQPKQEQPVQQEEFKAEERTVYITPTGERYHKKTCRTIKGDCTEIDINDAIARGYTSCGVCGG